MTLKSVDDVEVSGFDDEFSATEIAYLAKNFRNFLRNNNRKARGANTAELRNFRKNDPTKVNNNDKPREKVGQSSNSSMGPQRLLTLPRTLEIFSGIKIERQEVRTLLNLEILGKMIPLRLTIMTNLEKK